MFSTLASVSSFIAVFLFFVCINRLLGCGRAKEPDQILSKWYQSKVWWKDMDDSLGGMFKLTGSNYSVWKSKMRDMVVVKDLWLPV